MLHPYRNRHGADGGTLGEDSMRLIGEVDINAVEQCSDCGITLYGDNGVYIGTKPVCLLKHRCMLRQARAQLDAKAAKGVLPRWRA